MDLAFRGVDIGAAYRRREWRKLLNLIDHLPRASHYRAAVANDEQLAERVAEQMVGKESEPMAPPLDEWSTDSELLAAIFDRLGNLLQVHVASIPGNKAPQISPWLRPVTAMQRAAEQAKKAKRWVEYQSIVDRIVVK